MLWGALTSVAFAGGWTQPAGQYYVKAGYRGVPGFPTSAGFGANGEIVPLRRYGDHALQAYGEFGLSDQWTGVLSGTPIGLAAYDGARSAYAGPIRVGIRRALTTGRVRTAAEVQIGGTPALGTDDLAPEPNVGWIPAIENGSASTALQLGYGWENSWLSVDAGFRVNTGLAHVVFGGLQLGRQWNHLVLDLHVPLGWSLTQLEAPLNYMGSGDTQYIGVGVGLGWWFGDHVGLATGAEAVVHARSNAESFTFPLYLQLR